MDNNSEAAVCKAANNILDKWKLTDSEKIDILGFSSKAELDDFIKCIYTPDVTQERDMRISLILNIHAELRQMFNNSHNLYGFMKMVNHNPPCDGETPLGIACKSLAGLRCVFESIARLRHIN